MAGYTPHYTYPNKRAQFEGQPDGPKRLKDIKEVSHEDYGGWWPSFFPTVVGLLVTGDDKQTNVMTVSCLSAVNAYPFMVGFPVFGGERSTRGVGPRYSLELLQANPEFTLNLPAVDAEMTKQIIICGSLTGRDGVDKMAKAGLTPLPSRHVAPPIIKECQLNLECRLHSDTFNGTHHWMVGRVEAVHLDEEIASGQKQIVWRSLFEVADAARE